MVVLNILFICMVLSVLCFICSHTSQTALPCNLKISFFHLAATSKDMSEADSVLVAQNGTAITKKLPISLPELEYKEKGKDGGKDKKQQQQQNSIGINNNILQTVDAKLQDIEYMENHLNTKRLNNELGGSAENLFLKEEGAVEEEALPPPNITKTPPPIAITPLMAAYRPPRPVGVKRNRSVQGRTLHLTEISDGELYT